MLTTAGSRCTVGGEVGPTRGVNRERQHQVGVDRSPRVPQARRRRRRGRGSRRGVPAGRLGGHHEDERAKPLRIGNLLTLSGPSAAPSIDVKRGFVAYVKAHGSRLGGRKIQFIDADDANNPATAIRQVQKLVSEDQRRRDRGDLLLERPARRP